MNRKQVLDYIREEYEVLPDYPFLKSPEHAVFRHKRSRKWFGLLLKVPGSKLGLSQDLPVDVLNVKCDPELTPVLRSQPGIYLAYHMNKNHWISILLDGTVATKEVKQLLQASYHLTKET
ncbi:MmcQ/YjbR family DNA-binding protein [Proteiniclasticum ruminis]|uniref:Predicted DNA-binding protein, MmcQ/YjbR family n=1 Tax=Proteiniclasticum ruminis TaxID=398199 RepID=A0A1I5AHH2_9CLOT|nr:MmcQ/YjbR family DNA-binding protein [Proteiniclasticum ruminis]SFN61885.1 Predicted DNA-binding protein, MmcQ/YjbR family [Proteiniclasticum ruminis]